MKQLFIILLSLTSVAYSQCYVVPEPSPNVLILEGSQTFDTLNLSGKSTYIKEGADIRVKHTVIGYADSIFNAGSYQTTTIKSTTAAPYILVITMKDLDASFKIGGQLSKRVNGDNLSIAFKYCNITLPLSNSIKLAGMDSKHVLLEIDVLPHSNFQKTFIKIDNKKVVPVDVPNTAGKHIIKIKKEDIK